MLYAFYELSYAGIVSKMDIQLEKEKKPYKDQECQTCVFVSHSLIKVVALMQK